MSAFDAYEQHDLLGLADLVRTGETTPEELLEAALERIEARNPALNAFVHVMEDAARAAVAAGLPDGPLRGVPYALKDLYMLYAGAPTTNGSRLYADHVADHDSTLVARLRAAGLVIVGKTNTPELGLNASTEPVLHGPTRNPWAPDRTPGGSSGGAAAAVAAGMLPAAHATDGGGSIRIPASDCGLFGLKPSRGRNPQGPDVGEGWSGLATGHAVTRTVRDSAALLDATHGPAPGDPYAAPPPARRFLEEVGADPGRLRIGLWTEGLAGERIDPECVRAAEDAARLCESLGHHVEPALPPIDGAALRGATTAIIAGNVAHGLDLRAESRGRPVADGEVENATRRFAEMGRSLTARDYARALFDIHAIGRRLGGYFERFDVVLSPTLADPPLLLGTLDMMEDDFDAFSNRLLDHIPFTPLFNISGCPAASLPLHWTADNLPVGVQIGARFGDEATLLRLAASIEQARPWRDATRRLPWGRRPG